ncbi:pullulanase-associated domain-containing protein [Streptomyces sp. NPDC005534]|uniref:pullulanase-associated domain-containing protein n=1 Tax=Streptomyces sp. NPDC005534 TaxID=3155714 RepID=UPI003454750B
MHYHRADGDYTGWGLHTWTGAASPTDWTTTTDSAPHRTRKRRRRRSRSVGAVCTVQASNSRDLSSVCAALPAVSPSRAADLRAASGSAVPAASSRVLIAGSVRPSTLRRTKAARPAAVDPDRAWPSAISSAPPARGNSRSPHTTGRAGIRVRGGGSRRGQPRGERPYAIAERRTAVRSRSFSATDRRAVPRGVGTCGPGNRSRGPGSERCTSEWATRIRRCLFSEGGSVRYARRTRSLYSSTRAVSARSSAVLPRRTARGSEGMGMERMPSEGADVVSRRSVKRVTHRMVTGRRSEDRVRSPFRGGTGASAKRTGHGASATEPAGEASTGKR